MSKEIIDDWVECEFGYEDCLSDGPIDDMCDEHKAKFIEDYYDRWNDLD